jgi:hypothetical protein
VLQGEVHSPKTVKRRVKVVRERLRDKSLKEDHIMRLYEFTDPSEYLLPATDAVDLLKQTKNVWNDDIPDDASHHLGKGAETRNPTDKL